jgi:hypothetical protein
MIGRVADRAAPHYRAFFRAQGRRIAESAVRSSAAVLVSSGGIDRRDLSEIDWTEEEQRFLQILTRNHQLAGETAFAAVNDALSTSISFDLNNPNVRNVIDRLALRVVDINNQTRQDVARIVGEALDEGTDIPGLAKRLRGLFEETYRNRSATIARTESQIAYNSAAAVGYRETGLVDRCQLFDNAAHDTDPLPPTNTTCADRDGRVVGLDEVDDYIASAHPNCQLAVSPVLAGEN